MDCAKTSEGLIKKIKSETPDIEEAPECSDLSIDEDEKHDQNNKWIEYVRSKQNLFQDGRHISKKHKWAGMAVKAFIIHKEEIILVKVKKNVVPVRIKDHDPTGLHVKTFGPEPRKMFRIDFTEVVTSSNEAQAALEQIHGNCLDRCRCGKPTGFETDFYDASEFGVALGFGERPLYQLIDIGHYLEVQLPEKPETVLLGEVCVNHRGLLLISFGKFKRWFHMLDPYVHSVGWVHKQKTTFFNKFSQSVSYRPGYRKKFLAAAKMKTPPYFVFRENIIYTHRLQDGDIVVLIDEDMLTFSLAHVLLTDSQHFFHVCIGNEVVENTIDNRPFEFHVYHRRILSYEQARCTGLYIQIPKKLYVHQGENIVYAYQKAFTRRMIEPVINIGCHYQFEGTAEHFTNEALNGIYGRRISKLKYIEVMRTTPSGQLQMRAAQITGKKSGLYRLRVCDDQYDTYAHYFDPCLWQVGSSHDLEIPIKFRKDFFDKLDEVIEKYGPLPFGCSKVEPY